MPRVLIADNCADAARSLGRLLHFSGMEVRVKSDGMAAITTFEDFCPNAVILEVAQVSRTGQLLR